MPDAQAPHGRGPNSILDEGPTTVLGDRPGLVDPIVQELATLLEKAAAEAAIPALEVEVRLGVLQLRSQRGCERAQLPFASEAALKRTPGFAYRFVPGLPTEVFIALSQRLDAMSGDSVPSGRRLDCGMPRYEHTKDVYFRTPDKNRIRVTHNLVKNSSDGKDQPQAWMKRNLNSIDLYSGHRTPYSGPAFDLRAAVSTEEMVDNSFLGPENTLEMMREKRRKSYFFRAWRIDVTSVTTTFPEPEHDEGEDPSRHAQPPQHSCEVEVELDSYPLQLNLEAKLKGGPHKLYELLSDFLYTARDLAAMTGEVEPLMKPIPLEASAPVPSDEGRNAFKDVYPDITEPVIGHYLYRLAEERQSAKRLRTEEPSANAE